MKFGTVYQRHLSSCPRAAGGGFKSHRCKGLWSFHIDGDRDSSGKRRQITKGGFKTKAAAKAALQEQLGVLMADVDSHGITLGEYLEIWIAGKHALRPKTVGLYRYAIDLYIKPHLGHVVLQDLRAHHLDHFYSAIRTGRKGRPLSSTTLRRIHSVLRSALSTAVRRRLIAYSPAEHVELAPDRTRQPSTWNPEQCRTFLNFSTNDDLAPLYYLMLVTGLRRGEAIGLRWMDIDLERACLSVRQQIVDIDGRRVIGQPKTKRGARIVPLDPDTTGLLERLRSQAGKATRRTLVFGRPAGVPVRPDYVSRHFQVLARQAGLPVIRLHDLRHTNASLALAAGVDIKVVSDRLGHSTTAITADLYTHVDRGVGREAAHRIASVLGADVSEVLATATDSRLSAGTKAAKEDISGELDPDVTPGQEDAR